MNNLIYTLFSEKPELQKTVLMAFRRIHSDASLEPSIREILTGALLRAVRNQDNEQTQYACMMR